MAPSALSYLVIGGAGFFGSHIVMELLVRDVSASSISIFDLETVPEAARIRGVQYYTGDITDEKTLLEAFAEIQPYVVFHTVSPVYGLPPPIYYNVNERGSRIILSVCQKTGVQALIYTSTTGVTWTGKPLHGVTEETATIPEKGYNAYNHTKAIAEKFILAANDVKGLRTVALRCCGMIGEQDKQLITRLQTVIDQGQQNIRIGNNKNLVDWVYGGNAAYAHILAAEKVLKQPDIVGGQVFFITNDEPIPFWDFTEMVMRELGDDGKKPIIKIPVLLALLLAILVDIWCRLTGATTQFTIYSVKFSALPQWYNIDKAKRLLGYEPKVPLEEGVKRTVRWWKEVGESNEKRRLASKKDV